MEWWSLDLNGYKGGYLCRDWSNGFNRDFWIDEGIWLWEKYQIATGYALKRKKFVIIAFIGHLPTVWRLSVDFKISTLNLENIDPFHFLFCKQSLVEISKNSLPHSLSYGNKYYYIILCIVKHNKWYFNHLYLNKFYGNPLFSFYIVTIAWNRRKKWAKQLNNVGVKPNKIVQQR